MRSRLQTTDSNYAPSDDEMIGEDFLEDFLDEDLEEHGPALLSFRDWALTFDVRLLHYIVLQNWPLLGDLSHHSSIYLLSAQISHGYTKALLERWFLVTNSLHLVCVGLVPTLLDWVMITDMRFRDRVAPL